MIRIADSDKAKAKSLIDAAERNMKYTLTLKVTSESSSTIVRNVYESFRMLGNAVLISKGIKSEDHIAQINELMGLKVTVKRPLLVLDNLRRIRNNINYGGYSPTEKETENVIDIAKNLFTPILKAVREEISSDHSINK